MADLFICLAVYTSLRALQSVPFTTSFTIVKVIISVELILFVSLCNKIKLWLATWQPNLSV